MSTNIIILCPHNAAKSVYAAATLRQKAVDAGMQVGVSTGGTDPDDIVLPIVRERLEALGHTVNADPKMVTGEALDAADLIINIGCEHGDLPTSRPITDWTIPNFSDDPVVAFAALDTHVDRLLTDL